MQRSRLFSNGENRFHRPRLSVLGSRTSVCLSVRPRMCCSSNSIWCLVLFCCKKRRSSEKARVGRSERSVRVRLGYDKTTQRETAVGRQTPTDRPRGITSGSTNLASFISSSSVSVFSHFFLSTSPPRSLSFQS